MGDRQEAVASLALAAETSKAALLALSAPGILPADQQQPTLDVLHKDLISLLSLVYSDATKLSIALKPSKPTFSASVAVLKELSSHVLALSANVNLFDEETHGAALIREARDVVRDVIEAVNGLLQTFLDLNATGRPATSGSGAAGEEYLVRTGTVHALVERARGPNGLSKDNRDAVRKKWAEDRSTLEDALKEMNEAIEDAEQEGYDEDGEEAEWAAENDAEWAELGIQSKMTQEELQRAKSIQPLLRVTTLLHKRVLIDILKPPSSSIPIQNQTLDSLLSHSTTLQLRFDDLVAAALYSSQKADGVIPAINGLTDVLTALRGVLNETLRDRGLDEQIASMNIGDETRGKEEGKKVADPKEWYDMCFQQVYKLADAARATGLSSNSKPA